MTSDFLPARMRLRPASLPLFWRKITSARGLAGHVQKRDWQLVLNARGVPFCLVRFNSQEHLYTPAIYERLAAAELGEFAAESASPGLGARRWPVHRRAWLAALAFLPLIFLHGLRLGWWPAPASLPPPSRWLQLGCLDAGQIEFHGQWYRCLTALCLHADLRHLADNILFGAIFLVFLARLIGPGRAILFSIVAGALANGLSVLVHTAGYRSAGFSTALFACVGIMAGIMFWRAAARREMLMPVAAAAALLALLGTEGENTDYGAHLAGIFAGLCLGLLLGRWPRLEAIPQGCAAVMGIGMPALAWWYALKLA